MKAPVLNKDYQIEDKGYESKCFIWKGPKQNGYAIYKHHKKGEKPIRMHRWMWETFKGQPIPDGYDLERLCKQRDCIKPTHCVEVLKPKKSTQ